MYGDRRYGQKTAKIGKRREKTVSCMVAIHRDRDADPLIFRETTPLDAPVLRRSCRHGRRDWLLLPAAHRDLPMARFRPPAPCLDLAERLASRSHHVSLVSTPWNITRLPPVRPVVAPLVGLVALPLPRVAGL
jgi:hypothetical protein